MVSALPQRSENSHHVSMIENYPATLEVLGEPIRQVSSFLNYEPSKHRGSFLMCLICLTSLTLGTFPSVGGGSRSKDILQRSPSSRLSV